MTKHSSIIAIALLSLASQPQGCPDGLDWLRFEAPSGLPIQFEYSRGLPVPSSSGLIISEAPCPIRFTAASASHTEWLVVTPSHGFIASSSSVSMTLSLDVSKVPIEPGSYAGSIAVLFHCENDRPGSIHVPVRLTIRPPFSRIEEPSSINVSGAPLSGEWSEADPAPSGRVDAAAVWTGREVLVVGGTENGVYASGVDRFDPLTGAWDHMTIPQLPGRSAASAEWTGRETLVFGGVRNGGVIGEPVSVDPDLAIVRSLPTARAPSPRVGHISAWTGQEWLIWGGRTNQAYLDDGSIYSPRSNRWRSIRRSGAPTARAFAAAVWSGSELILFGGRDARGAVGSAAAYNPRTDTWRSLAPQRAPSERWNAKAVWTGRSMIVVGGESSSGPEPDGSAFDPARNTWTTIAFPYPRIGMSTVWTGREVVIFGGEYQGSNQADTWAMDGSTFTWVPLPKSPIPRTGHAALWTGSEMIVVGGMAGGIAETRTSRLW